MRTSILLSLATLLVALPADGQERRERVERRVAPRISIARAPVARLPRAVLGVMTAPGTGLADTAGVLVRDVMEDSPAARAGIREGDRLTQIDGVSLRIAPADAGDPVLASIGSRRLTRELEKHGPGDEVELRVASGNASRAVRVRLVAPDSLRRTRAAAAPLARARAIRAERLGNRASLGLQVGTTGSRRDTLGVFVMGADDQGPAARAGIIEGARIAAINGTDLRVSAVDADDPAVATARVRQLTRELAEVKPGDEVELRVWQNGQYRTARVRTVPADSLSRTRRTVIIGDGQGWPDMFLRETVPPIPGVPPAGAMDMMRFRLAPELREELRLMLDDARFETFRGTTIH